MVRYVLVRRCIVDALTQTTNQLESLARSTACGGDQEVVMAKVIEFYIPKNFRKPLNRAPQLQCGKIVEFSLQTKKSA